MLFTEQGDLASFSDAPEPNIRFLAMLAGPFYPILHIVNERFDYLADDLCMLLSTVTLQEFPARLLVFLHEVQPSYLFAIMVCY